MGDSLDRQRVLWTIKTEDTGASGTGINIKGSYNFYEELKTDIQLVILKITIEHTDLFG